MPSSKSGTDASKASLWEWKTWLRCATFLIPWLFQLLLADVLLSVLLPVSIWLPELCYDTASRIAATIWLGIQSIFTKYNHAEITLSGLGQIRQGESAIVVSNHVGWTDFYMIQELAIEAGMLGRSRWFAKAQLKYVPFLGWGLWAMGMCLVSREWTHDRKEMDRVFSGVVQHRRPIWLIAYSEATRYTAEKRREAETWCKATGKRLGKHLLYPRTKGFVACVQNLRKTQHVTAVYDVTIAYAKDGKVFQMPPSFVESLMLPDLNKDYRFFAHVDRYSIRTLPEDYEEISQWLEERWLRKGELLERLQHLLAEGEPWDESSLSTMKLN
ncbi:hypothetical protein LTR27_003361 [Elasticomyces elasticus]|nr:hypothetical protein LTR27_003361 [Elasticomyces elasticus]